MKNGNGRKIAAHDEQIKTLFKSIDQVNKRFNDEIGTIRNDVCNVKEILKGKGEETGIVGKVNMIHEKMKNSERRMALWISGAVSLALIVFQYLLPKMFGM